MNYSSDTHACPRTTGPHRTARNAGAVGCRPAYIFTDRGLTRGACRLPKGGHTGCPKPDRLARSLRGAKDIVDELTGKQVKLSIGGSVDDPLDPVGRLLFQSARNGGGIRIGSDSCPHPRGNASRNGERSPAREATEVVHSQQRHLMEVHNACTHTTAELAELCMSRGRPSTEPSNAGWRSSVNHPSPGSFSQTPPAI